MMTYQKFEIITLSCSLIAAALDVATVIAVDKDVSNSLSDWSTYNCYITATTLTLSDLSSFLNQIYLLGSLEVSFDVVDVFISLIFLKETYKVTEEAVDTMKQQSREIKDLKSKLEHAQDTMSQQASALSRQASTLSRQASTNNELPQETDGAHLQAPGMRSSSPEAHKEENSNANTSAAKDEHEDSNKNASENDVAPGAVYSVAAPGEENEDNINSNETAGNTEVQPQEINDMAKQKSEPRMISSIKSTELEMQLSDMITGMLFPCLFFVLFFFFAIGCFVCLIFLAIFCDRCKHFFFFAFVFELNKINNI